MFDLQVEYVNVGGIQVPKAKFESAKRLPNAYKMARKLLPLFFSSEELRTCTCAPPRGGANTAQRPQADGRKLALLLGM